MDESLQEKLRIIAKEAFRYRKVLVLGFALISLSVLISGLFIQRVYESSVTILVQETDIIQPLMQGRAVATEVIDRTQQARELIYSRQLLAKVMKAVGWLSNPLTPTEEEQIREGLKERIVIQNSGENFIVISYKDTDPQRVKLITDKIAEYFIEDSRNRKSEESRKAYEFVDSQVKAYHAKLVEAENNLKDFRSNNAEVRTGALDEIGRRISALKSEIEQTKLAIAEEGIRRASLERQLSGEAGLTSSLTREGQYLSRIAELQYEIDTLKLSYTDTHPDVVVLKHQIEDMKRAIDKERLRDRSTNQGDRGGNEIYVDEGIRLSPLYETLRSQLSQSKTLIDTLNARLIENKKILEREIELEQRVHESEATLSELNRDYEVNQQIYNDLLRRRENARVSMNMDISQKGLALKVYEPAYLPVIPSGLRLLHFFAAGIILGVLIPIGLLVAYLEVDPNIRNKKVFEAEFELPVITSVPRWISIDEQRRINEENRLLVYFISLVVMLYLAIPFARIKGLI